MSLRFIAAMVFFDAIWAALFVAEAQIAATRSLVVGIALCLATLIFGMWLLQKLVDKMTP